MNRIWISSIFNPFAIDLDIMLALYDSHQYITLIKLNKSETKQSD